ncbi:flagellar hook assembly protein FlgD [Lysobacter yangpyeongensis]|uniref:Basal-body rod modification protein FlgD n=1 Tax=Lysobacter yangpyeongensis TaxID=346182 RepID=A0ABW0SIX0_9GAMM
MTTVGTNNNADSLASLGLSVQQNARSTSLGQADFLRLMTEQLKNQDPLKPLDNAQFLGQLAQFSTVQGIDKMQNAMQAVASVMESDQTLRAAALVGRDALVETDTLDVQAGAAVNGEIAATGAGPITLEIVDAAGTRVRTMTVQANAAGGTPFQWDGKDDSGKAVAAGRYTVRATSGTGDDAEALAVGVAARIDSVSIEPSGLVLNLEGLGSHPLSAIRRIG